MTPQKTQVRFIFSRHEYTVALLTSSHELTMKVCKAVLFFLFRAYPVFKKTSLGTSAMKKEFQFPIDEDKTAEVNTLVWMR